MSQRFEEGCTDSYYYPENAEGYYRVAYFKASDMVIARLNDRNHQQSIDSLCKLKEVILKGND